MTMEIDRARGALLGLACGDAVGTTVEFSPRDTVAPVMDMVGGGPFGLAPGEWTDDTSMALCLADSLLTRGTFDAVDQLQRYLRWRREGYLSSTGQCFDVGATVGRALDRFARTGDPASGPTDPSTAGNGSLMRLAPVVLFYYPHRERIDRYAAESSRTTHGAEEAIASCRMLATVLHALLSGQTRAGALRALQPKPWMSDRLCAVASGDYRYKARAQISGSGYAVECLEAALWCFLRASSFEDAVLTAANLGNDADTTAAVCGQLAGAYFGVGGIPARWREQVVLGDQIQAWAERLMTARPT